jgi:hypothetical protein
MFESQNFFKSIQCPYLSSNNSSINGSNLCERPYCQFKHHSNTEIKSNSRLPQLNNSEKQQIIKETVSTITNDSTQKLPDALQNLSQALQAVQDLMKLKNQGNSTDLSPNSSNNLTTSIANQLSSLSSTILSTNNNELKNNGSAADSAAPKSKKPINEFKRQQLQAPAYNPTPIDELKKMPKTEPQNTIENDVQIIDLTTESYEEEHDIKLEEPEAKKRKTPLNTPALITSTISTSTNSFNFSVDDQSSSKKLKPLGVENTSVNYKKEEKIDLLSFSKLTAKQQLLKRYEIMKKEAPPTANELREAKLKKKQTELQQQQLKTQSDSSTIDTSLLKPNLLFDQNDPLSNKVPLAMRHRQLNFVFENLRPLISAPSFSLSDACKRASEEEKSLYDRASNKTIYLNFIANAVKKIRNELAQKQPSSSFSLSSNNNKLINSPTKIVNVVSHEALISGPKATRVSYSINKIKQVEIRDLTGKNI